jgi:hypothetical protein
MSVEFDYLKELTEEFFSTAHIRQSLNIIYTREITGWEIWLQIELSRFLSQHESEPEWYREEEHDYDRRMEKGKSFLKPDFLIRKKGWKKYSYFALELKQHREAANCISNMKKDMARVEKIKQSSVDLRNYWVLGVYLRKPKTEIKELILDALDSHGYEYDDSVIVNKYIPKTKFGYCIF